MTKKFLSIFIIGLIIFGCGKKEVSPVDSKSSLSYNNKAYELNEGFWMVELDANKNVEATSLFLYNSSAQLHFKDGFLDSFDGTLTGILVEVYMTKGVKELEPGEYKYGIRGKKVAKTFVGDIFLEARSDNSNDRELKNGLLTVKKENDVYEITFNCTDEYGINIIGYYKGKLPIRIVG